MSEIYFFVDEDGTEGVSNTPPRRNPDGGQFWIAPIDIPLCRNKKTIDDIVELPKGTIQTLFGRILTWKDNPILIEF